MVAAQTSWDTARSNCRGRGTGWDLTSIRSATDGTFVHGLLAQEAWIGASDAASESNWSWVDDGSPFWQGNGAPAGHPLNGAYANWYNDEPNGTETSDCVRLLLDGTWADLQCYDVRSSICEGRAR